MYATLRKSIKTRLLADLKSERAMLGDREHALPPAPKVARSAFRRRNWPKNTPRELP